MACQMFDLECMVYMVKVSYHQKPYRRSMMQLWGANVIPSPSDQTNAGRAVLAEDPDSLGSLGIAISEAVEDAVTHPGSKYALGSVTNHVLLHQTVIGEEAILQCQDADAYPDVVIGCVGGGSSFGGIAFPFLRENLAGKTEHAPGRRRADGLPVAHQGSVPSTTSATRPQTTPLFKMYTLGHDFMPAGIHAGGLRYHAMAPLLSHVYDLGLMEAVAVPQTKVFAAAQLFVQTEGIVPAPESAHAIRVGHRRGPQGQGRGREPEHPVQPHRPRLPRPRRLRRLPERQARGLRPPGGGDRGVDREAPEGRLSSRSADVVP